MKSSDFLMLANNFFKTCCEFLAGQIDHTYDAIWQLVSQTLVGMLSKALDSPSGSLLWRHLVRGAVILPLKALWKRAVTIK